MTRTLLNTVIIFSCLFLSSFTAYSQCNSTATILSDPTPVGGGNYSTDIQVCVSGPGAVFPTHGFNITMAGVNIVTSTPISVTNNGETLNQTIAGSTVNYGLFSDGVTIFADGTTPLACFTFTIVTDGPPVDWTVVGMEFNSATSASLCNLKGTFCYEDAGFTVGAGGPTISQCADQPFNLGTAGSTLDPNAANPCIGWGYWLLSDPLGNYTTLTPGGPPDLLNPSVALDGTVTLNHNGVFSGGNILPATNDGATWYIAPVTLSNCGVSYNPDCVDIGDPITIYSNPTIQQTTAEIDCFDQTALTTFATFDIFGGQATTTGSTFTITNTGAGTLSTPAVISNNGTVTIDNIPDGGTVSILVTDGLGCSQNFMIGPIASDDHCTGCAADAGDVTLTQGGSGNTSTNNGVNSGGPFILCWGDNMSFSSNGNSTNSPDAPCGTCSAANCLGGSFIWNSHFAPPTSGNPTDPTTSAGWGFGGFNGGNFNVNNNNSHFNTTNGQLSAGGNSPFVNNTGLLHHVHLRLVML